MNNLGDPRKIRKQYARPRMIWNEENLALEKELAKEYRVKNKQEIWKATTFLDNIKDQAKSITSKLNTANDEQALKQKELLIQRVKRLGIIKKDEVSLGDLLTLSVRDIMDRRLQTLLTKKKLGRTVAQARQFIVHGHVKVGDKKITSPSYLVPAADEELISFTDKSALSNPTHPERGDVDPAIVLKQKQEMEEVAAAEIAKAKKAEKDASKGDDSNESKATEAEAKTENVSAEETKEEVAKTEEAKE